MKTSVSITKFIGILLFTVGTFFSAQVMAETSNGEEKGASEEEPDCERIISQKSYI